MIMETFMALLTVWGKKAITFVQLTLNYFLLGLLFVFLAFWVIITLSFFYVERVVIKSKLYQFKYFADCRNI